MTKAGMKVSFADYKRIALEDPRRGWELVRGHLREKPPMTMKHEVTARRLPLILGEQLGWREWTIGPARLRISTGTYYIPDFVVVPMSLARKLRPNQFEVYEDSVPLVVEIWSPSTGDYDVDEKLREYQLRGDLEIWRIHPYEHTLTAWRRQPDGSYTEEVITGGIVRPVALPNVSIDLDDLLS
jgi:Uma2 family endonuclease